jgi:AAA domain
MSNFFKPAKLEQSKLRLALYGPSGSGKTFTALAIAGGLGERIALIDSERGSSAKYAPPRGPGVPFCKLDLTSYEPAKYVRALGAAASEGFDVAIIDSLSHAWFAEGGILDQKDRSGGSFDAWAKLSPQQNSMLHAILTFPGHVIVTMRSKMEYVLEQRENKQGKTVSMPKKVGLAPVQRNDLEYEFDLAIMLDGDNVGHVQKTRFSELQDAMIRQPGATLATQLLGFLNEGEAPAAAPPVMRGMEHAAQPARTVAKADPTPEPARHAVPPSMRETEAPPPDVAPEAPASQPRATEGPELTESERSLIACIRGTQTRGQLADVGRQIPEEQKTSAVRAAFAEHDRSLRAALRGAA